MIEGSTPASARETSLRRGFRPSSFAFEAVITTTAAAPSLMPLALPAVTMPSGLNAGLSFPSASIVVWRGCSSWSMVTRLLALLHLDRHDLVLELAGRDGGGSALLRAHRDLVLRLAGDLVLLGQVLGRDAHVGLAEGVAEQVQ